MEDGLVWLERPEPSPRGTERAAKRIDDRSDGQKQDVGDEWGDEDQLEPIPSEPSSDAAPPLWLNGLGCGRGVTGPHHVPSRLTSFYQGSMGVGKSVS